MMVPAINLLLDFCNPFILWYEECQKNDSEVGNFVLMQWQQTNGDNDEKCIYIKEMMWNIGDANLGLHWLINLTLPFFFVKPW
jgi:hypothetical protein